MLSFNASLSRKSSRIQRGVRATVVLEVSVLLQNDGNTKTHTDRRVQRQSHLLRPDLLHISS